MNADSQPGISATSISLLLFDVGGVLVELKGVETMMGWLGDRVSTEDMWRMWLQSKPVREFETGRIGADEFAAGVIAEFRLPVDSRQFIASFTEWPTGLYPGTLEMLAEIPPSFGRAVLSNSNALHWTRVTIDMKLGAAFEHQFVSHLTGRIKPDPDAFEQVVDSMGVNPQQVLFLDDNQINVDAAKRFGMQAGRVQGLPEAKQLLRKLGMLAKQEAPA